ncbi:hypothetical protein C1Y63_11110 [Corynebacterium sp. 13CS0277]|uniref:hypothetical protein n=1 Tax=Corynebacterium sp. 13CS0277 TaxID=2071994 RepID=UPI000D02E8F1|nr:hypothetical protein [Corynebacterium sp. 13CS0277]PRQ10527.1 hypothetical protein C1Y63_11110 [Corynebacterium sp. 13CS0277]
MTTPYPGNEPAQDPTADANVYGSAYAAGGYPGTGYASEPTGELRRNTLAPWGLGLGIGALVLCWSAVGGLLLGLIGIILSIIALTKAKHIIGPFQRKGMAIGGLLVSILGLVAGAFFAFVYFLGFTVFSEFDEQCNHLRDDQDAYTQCIQDAAAAMKQEQQ